MATPANAVFRVPYPVLAFRWNTEAEVQTIRLVAHGHRNKEVAGVLSIAEETVRMHMKNILGKLAAHDRTHAVTIAVTRGVFQL